jgi:hypothetical protein
VPATEIEMNGLTPGKPYTLVVEAVDALGPASQGCLYDSKNMASFTRLCNLSLLGSNMGCTGDEKMTTNGQGPKDNNPRKIVSAIACVTPTGRAALPGSKAASQVLFDTFDRGFITQVGRPDIREGIERFTMKTPAAMWEIRTEKADTRNSQVFLMNKHFMDVLFDGGTPGSNNPLHQGHAVISLSPTKTADFSGGKIIHVTQEVDAQLASRRWIDFRLTPADDPYLSFETNHRINQTDTDLMIQIFGPNITVDEHTGPKNANDPASLPIGTRLVGAEGQGTYNDCRRPGRTAQGTVVLNAAWQNAAHQVRVGYQQGRGLDDRSRFDVFVSKTHIAVYEDGVKICEHDLATPLSFDVAKVYFSHYHYHSALEVEELRRYAPYESFWLTTFPHSDERHWDNMGFEVLPATTRWSTLADTVQPPAFK